MGGRKQFITYLTLSKENKMDARDGFLLYACQAEAKTFILKDIAILCLNHPRIKCTSVLYCDILVSQQRMEGQILPVHKLSRDP